MLLYGVAKTGVPIDTVLRNIDDTISIPIVRQVMLLDCALLIIDITFTFRSTLLFELSTKKAYFR
jgi:hypothetical protein